MSKLLLSIISFVVTSIAFGQVESKIQSEEDLLNEKLKNHGIVEMYSECDSSKPKKLSKVGMKTVAGKEKLKNGLQNYKDCNDNMGRLKNFVISDGEIEVDPEGYLREIKSVIKNEHMAHIEKHLEPNKEASVSMRDVVDKLLTEYTHTYTGAELKQIDSASFDDSFTDQTGVDLIDVDSVISTPSYNNPRHKEKFQKNTEKAKLKLQQAQQRDQNEFLGKSFTYVDTCIMRKDCPDIKEVLKRDETKYIEEGAERLSKGNKSNLFVETNTAYFERLAKKILLTSCNFVPRDECDATLRGSLKSLIEGKDYQADEGVNVLAVESFKMVGHFQSLRKFERYIAIEKKEGIFEGDSRAPSYCIRESRYTADFGACQKIAGAQNLKTIADLSKSTAGGIATEIQSQNIQNKYQRDVANGKSIGEAAMDASSQAYTGQRDIATTASAAYGGSATTLSVMLKSYPSEGLYSRRCKNQKEELDNKVDYCYILQSLGSKIFANKQMKDQAWRMVGQLTGDSLKHALEAMHFNDMAKETQGMKNDLTGALEEIATIGFDSCQNNPELCNDQSGSGTTTTLGMGDYTLGSNGYDSQAFVQPTESTGEIDTSSGLSKTQANQLSDSLRDGGSSLSNGFNKIAAGKLGAASGGPGGGGGGGAGGGATGGGGSSAGDPQGQGAEAARGATPSSRGVFKRGRSIGFKKGGSSAKGKSKSPYSNLFNKSKGNRNIASEVNDIAAKESGLFKRISKRYESLANKNRLKSL